jgi:hypothetical protein
MMLRLVAFTDAEPSTPRVVDKVMEDANAFLAELQPHQTVKQTFITQSSWSEGEMTLRETCFTVTFLVEEREPLS